MTSVSAFLLQYGHHGGHHGPMGGHWGAGGAMGVSGPPVLLWLVVLVGLLGALGYVAVRGLSVTTADRGADAMAVLRERYARGEIDDEEFDERRARLVGDTPP